MARVQLYHTLCWSEEDEETTRLLHEDPRMQIIIATIVVGQGINVKILLNSIQLSFPVSLDQEDTGGRRLFRGLTNSMQNPSWLVKI